MNLITYHNSARISNTSADATILQAIHFTKISPIRHNELATFQMNDLELNKLKYRKKLRIKEVKLLFEMSTGVKKRKKNT